MHLIAEKSVEWDRPEPAPPVPLDVWNQLVSEARSRNRKLLKEEERENAALYARRRAALTAEHQHDLRVKEARLSTAPARGHKRIVPAMRGQLEKAEVQFQLRLAELEGTRAVTARLSEPLATCCVELRHPSE
jgi:hypothetical protein